MDKPFRIFGPRTLRSLLIAVAIAGCALGFHDRSRRRSERFRSLSRYHRAASLCAGDGFMPGPWCGSCLMGDRAYQEERDKIRRRFIAEAQAYHKGLAAKYSRAWQRPWLPVADDPLPPPLAFPDQVVDPSDDTTLARP